MRCLVTTIAVACLAFTACNKQEKAKSSGDSSGNPLNAPADYVGALGKAKQSAQKTSSAVSLDQSIKNFFVEENRYPKSLDELKAKGVTIPPPPPGMKWDYDPNSGIVKPVPQ